jgi:hypothetical protein
LYAWAISDFVEKKQFQGEIILFIYAHGNKNFIKYESRKYFDFLQIWFGNFGSEVIEKTIKKLSNTTRYILVLWATCFSSDSAKLLDMTDMQNVTILAASDIGCTSDLQSFWGWAPHQLHFLLNNQIFIELKNDQLENVSHSLNTSSLSDYLKQSFVINQPNPSQRLHIINKSEVENVLQIFKLLPKYIRLRRNVTEDFR